MANSSTDKSPQQGSDIAVIRKLKKLIAEKGKTGLEKIEPEKEDSPIHCCAEYHFARFTGPGKAFAPLLYGISCHIAGESANFFPSMTKLAAFLNTKRELLYAAADLLVASGFWEKIEANSGETVKYRPVYHKEWAEKYPGYCTAKLEIKFQQDDPELAALGKRLWAIFGGQEFHPNVLRGIRNAAPECTDEEICEHAKRFMADDLLKRGTKGKEFRKLFIEYLRTLDGWNEQQFTNTPSL